jgi:peptidyl-Lys metalloendopeptidase
VILATAGASSGEIERGGPPVSSECTGDELDILVARQITAQDWSADAHEHLDAILEPMRPSEEYYGRWFGEYDLDRWDHVRDNYVAIDAVMQEEYTYTCTFCPRTTLAYVYKDQPTNVWICPSFFSLLGDDPDFQAGIILHESSHWYAAANTNDYTYGEASCLSLADSYPDYAVNNADNYHYFARDLAGGLP